MVCVLQIPVDRRPPGLTPAAPLPARPLQLYGALATSCASLSPASRGMCCATKFVADTWDAYCAALVGGSAEVRAAALLLGGVPWTTAGRGEEGRGATTDELHTEPCAVQAPAPAPSAAPPGLLAAAAVGTPSSQPLLPGSVGTSGGSSSKVRCSERRVHAMMHTCCVFVLPLPPLPHPLCLAPVHMGAGGERQQSRSILGGCAAGGADPGVTLGSNPDQQCCSSSCI